MISVIIICVMVVKCAKNGDEDAVSQTHNNIMNWLVDRSRLSESTVLETDEASFEFQTSNHS